MKYLFVSPRIERAAADYLRKYGDGRSEALDDLCQLLVLERARGLRDAVVDVCRWLRLPDPRKRTGDAFTLVVEIAHGAAKSIEDLYFRDAEIGRLMCDEPPEETRKAE
jgi:hypothetical protein